METIIEKSIQTADAASDLLQALDTADQIKTLAIEGDIEKLSSLGFDPELLPIMQMFTKQGPRILGTYSHPTELDVHKIKSSILITNLCAENGVNPQMILVNQLDTRRIDASTKRPLGVSSFGLKPEIDPLKLNSTFTNVEQAASTLVSMLQDELTQELFNLGVSKSEGKELKRQIVGLLESRIEILLDMKAQQTDLSELEVNIEMKNFNVALANKVLGNIPQNEVYIRNIGSQTLYENEAYRSLISQSLQLLINIKGIDVIKSLSNPDKDHAIMRIYSDKDAGEIILTSDQKFKLQVNGCSQIISDEDFFELITNSLVLGKLEALALVAGGSSIHVGTDHGASPNAIRILGLSGKAAEMIVSNLTFGERNIRGHDGVVVGKNLVPLPLQFLMFGEIGLQEIINQPEAIKLSSVNELKALFAKSLINQAVNIEP